MDVRIRESVYVSQNGQEFVVRQGTIGVFRSGVYYFYDATKTVAVGYSREFCLSSNLFAVSRNITDTDVSLKEVIKIVESQNVEGLQNSDIPRILAEKLKSLK